MTINHHGAEVGDLNVKLLYEQQKNERQTVVNEQQSRQIHDMEKQVKVHNHISSSSFHVSNCRRCMRSVGLDVLNGSVKRGAESIPMPWMVGLRRTLLQRQRHVSSKPLRSKLATLTYFLSITSCPRVRFPSATLSANLFRKHLPHHMSPPCALAKLFWVPVNRPEYAPNQTIYPRLNRPWTIIHPGYTVALAGLTRVIVRSGYTPACYTGTSGGPVVCAARRSGQVTFWFSINRLIPYRYVALA